jgi:hypothetical protein
MIDDFISHDAVGKPSSSLAIISPMSRKHLGVATHDLDLLEGGMSKEVTDPKIVRYKLMIYVVFHRNIVRARV